MYAPSSFVTHSQRPSPPFTACPAFGMLIRHVNPSSVSTSLFCPRSCRLETQWSEFGVSFVGGLCTI